MVREVDEEFVTLFLRLELVEDSVGENTNNDMLELRIFLQCNGDRYELLDDILMVAVIEWVMGNGGWQKYGYSTWMLTNMIDNLVIFSCNKLFKRLI